MATTTGKHPKDKIEILLSPGTPAMQAVWILLGKTKYEAAFIQSSVEQGVQAIDAQFDIAAEYLPESANPSLQSLADLAAGEVAIDAAFDDILTKNKKMESLKAQATVLASHDVPVLIYGETGTGKELFATAIHNASSRREKPIIAVNCGAFPSELIDSALFGHVKGAFTGATSAKTGFFEAADGGTLFLDEFGELPAEAQVRLLRVLQSGEVTPVGGTSTRKVDVRIVAATNRDLMLDIGEGRFREDLIYRVAVGVLNLPPLRERTGDLKLLTDKLLQQINDLTSAEKDKKLSAGARKVILRHPWRGNVRELYSTLLRANLWSGSERITDKDIQAALFRMPDAAVGILGRNISEGFDIQTVIGEVM